MLLCQEAEKLSAWAIVQNEEKLLLGLERPVHLDDEWVAYPSENVALSHHLALLLGFLNMLLFQDLHGVQPFASFLFGEHNFRIRTLPYH
jgi:hypothetical protein